MLANEMTHDAIELQKPDYIPKNNVDNSAYYEEHGVVRTENGKELIPADMEEIVRIHYDSDMAAMIQLGRWFDMLRTQGIYDNTRIIVVSDHGCYLGLFGTDLKKKYGSLSAAGYKTDEWTDTMCYNPLLLVKDFGASGFHTDYRFMTNAETPSLACQSVYGKQNRFRSRCPDGTPCDRIRLAYCRQLRQFLLRSAAYCLPRR